MIYLHVFKLNLFVMSIIILTLQDDTAQARRLRPNPLIISHLTQYIMSKDKNAQVENVENVENNEVTEQAANATAKDANENVENEQTIEEQTAQRVLRAKLPVMAEKNFNFEKRTGNVFTASIVKVFKEDGTPELAKTGEQVEKLTRKVVIIEDEDGKLLPEFETLRADLTAKRAASFVLGAEKRKEQLVLKGLELVKELAENKEAIDSHDVTLHESCEVVMAVVLPEKAQRVNVSAKLTQATDKLDKMRVMLLAAGLTPEEIDEQMNA